MGDSVRTFKIAISGAGPAGLTLASLLHQNLPASAVTIKAFDLRPAPTAAALITPSGSLDLHRGSGLDAIDRCGLTSQFRTMIGDCSQEVRIVTTTDQLVQSRPHDDDGDRPEISRNALAHLLLLSLPEGLVTWKAKVRSVTKGTDRRWKLHFTQDKQQHEQEEEFDLIVGADGAWSKVRDAIPGVAKPAYSGLSTLMFPIRDLAGKHPDVAGFVGTGSLLACGEHKVLVNQRSVAGSTRMYVMVPHSSPTALGDLKLEFLSGAEVKEILMGQDLFFKGWGPKLQKLIAAACDAQDDRDQSHAEDDEPTAGGIETRPLYQLPRDHTWTHTPGLTLIGDAAHLTIPSGEGVNFAMLDALRLSEVLQEHIRADGSSNINEMDTAVAGFEKQVWELCQSNFDRATYLRKWMFDDDNAPYGLVEQFKVMAKAAGQNWE